MHRAAPVARLRLQVPAALRSAAEKLPRPEHGKRIAAITAGMFLLLWALLAYSPIAHPHDVEIVGATGSSAKRIEALLTEAAGSQSTFHTSNDDLMASLSDYPEVAGVEVHAHPPFRLDVQVLMRPPVARVEIGGRAFAIAGDGTVLRRIGGAQIPTLDASVGQFTLTGGEFHGGGGAITVLAKAPDVLLPMIRTVRRISAGIEIELERGPRLIFGSATGAADKWAAAAAVIADGSAAKATYIDVRVPGRPAVGGLGGSRVAGMTTDPSLAPPSLTLDPATAEAAAAATSTATTTESTGTATAGAGAGTGTQTGAGTGTASGAATGATETDTAVTPEADAPAAGSGTGTAGATQAHTDAQTQTDTTAAGASGTATAPSSGTSGGASLGGTAAP